MLRNYNTTRRSTLDYRAGLLAPVALYTQAEHLLGEMAFALHLTQAVKEHLLAQKHGYSPGGRALPPDHGRSR
jgi:hypothetical protein